MGSVRMDWMDRGRCVLFFWGFKGPFATPKDVFQGGCWGVVIKPTSSTAADSQAVSCMEEDLQRVAPRLFVEGRVDRPCSEVNKEK